MVSFLLHPDSAGFPLFAASVKHYHQWGSVNADPDQLDQVDPALRRISFRLRGPSIRIAWLNPLFPWDGYMPTTLLVGLDPLEILIRAPLDSEVISTRNGQYFVCSNWVNGVWEVASQVEQACRELMQAAEDLFKREQWLEEIDYSPLHVDKSALEAGFDSLKDARKAVELARAQALTNVGFLAWYTHATGGWANGLASASAEFVASLRLGERETRGYLLNLAADYHWVDLRLLIEHHVPFHYIWTPCLHVSGQFMRANPWLVARVLELKKRLGREPTNDEVLAGQGRAREVLGYDRWFAPRDATPQARDATRHAESTFFAEYFCGWFPHRLRDEALVAQGCEAYPIGDPTMDFDDMLSGEQVVIYRWAKKRDGEDEEDPLDDWGIFDVPLALRMGSYFHGRELRRLSCAPLPSEMSLARDTYSPQDDIEAIELQTLDGYVESPRRSIGEEWEEVKSSMPLFEYDSRLDYDEVPNVPITGYDCIDGREEHEMADHDPRKSKKVGKRAEEKRSLAERIGPARTTRAQFPVRMGEQEEGSSRARGRTSQLSSTRATSSSAARGRSRRSASPRAARDTPSPQSSAAGSRSARDYDILLPDPSSRHSLVTPGQAGWDSLVRRLDEELELLDRKLSPNPLPRANDVDGRVAWSSRVREHAYVVPRRAQDRVRLLLWRILRRHHLPEDSMEHLANIGAPIIIALPQSMYPATDQDRPLAPEESHNVSFVSYGVGGTALYENWVTAIRGLARRPHAPSLYFASDIAGYVLRRWAWDLMADKVGEGPCEDTRMRRGGKKIWPASPAIPTLFYDEASAEEIACLHGCIIHLWKYPLCKVASKL